jgi:glucokinase
MSKEKFAIGIDIGGMFIKYGICSEGGEILFQAALETPAESPKVVILENLTKIIQDTISRADNTKIEISAIGIGTPGSVDVKMGALRGGTPNFKFWRDVGIVSYLKNKVDIPIFVDNDANLMAFGEYIYGVGKGKHNIICITLGTGIGGGIIINGEIYRGSFYAGAELGHMTIRYDGKKCNCGGIGCWEKYGSAAAMIQDYNKKNKKNKVTSTRLIFQRLFNGEKIAQNVVNKSIDYISAGVTNILNIFNPEMIIIGGGLSEAGSDFINKIDDKARQRSMGNSAEKVTIRAASLGNRAGMLGAAAFALSMME